jgi:hypothetical protein
MWGAIAALAVGHTARFGLIGGMVWVGVRFMQSAKDTWKRRIAIGAVWIGVGFGLVVGVLLLTQFFQM